ncbi:DoxX family protein [Streptomyces sp. NPDC053499]|uniref:DoxX family protein n=1 Tax=Streptomyces sp. NPDC053499 TaxID=3365707 RepID=UPI0037D056C9
MSETYAAAPAATVSEGARSRRSEITVKVLTVLLALFLGLASGLPKLFRAEAATEAFDKIGWGDWFMYAVGSLEVLGAVALLIPILSGAAALAFIGLMAGATVFNLTVLDAPEAVITTTLLAAVLAYIARSRRAHTAQLLRRLRP